MATTIKYTKDHEYIRIDGDIGAVGITAFAQDRLGDVTYVEVPEVGKTVKAGEPAGVVESVKAASEVYSPVSGEIVAVNGGLVDNPALVNEDPENAAWFYKIKIADAGELDGLLDPDAYEAFVAEQH